MPILSINMFYLRIHYSSPLNVLPSTKNYKTHTHTHTHTHTQEGNNLSRGKTVNRNRPRVEPNVGTNRMELQNNCSQYVKDLVKKWTNLHEKNGGSSAV